MRMKEQDVVIHRWIYRNGRAYVANCHVVEGHQLKSTMLRTLMRDFDHVQKYDIDHLLSIAEEYLRPQGHLRAYSTWQSIFPHCIAVAKLRGDSELEQRLLALQNLLQWRTPMPN